jgi:hypothetical protein
MTEPVMVYRVSPEEVYTVPRKNRCHRSRARSLLYSFCFLLSSLGKNVLSEQAMAVSSLHCESKNGVRHSGHARSRSGAHDCVSGAHWSKQERQKL